MENVLFGLSMSFVSIASILFIGKIYYNNKYFVMHEEGRPYQSAIAKFIKAYALSVLCLFFPMLGKSDDIEKEALRKRTNGVLIWAYAFLFLGIVTSLMLIGNTH